MILNDLSIESIFTWAAVSFVAWYLISTFSTWYRLRHIPGPRLAAFSYLWELHAILSNKTFDKFLHLREYGPLVRITPDYLVTDDPDVLRTTMALRGTYTRDRWYSAIKFTPDSINMGNRLDTAAHDILKAKTANSYSGREIGTDLEKDIDAQVVRLVDLIRRKYISKGDDIHIVDFADLSRYFSLDVISLLFFGKTWGHLDEGKDVLGWINLMDSALPVMSVVMEVPLLRDLMLSKYGLAALIGPKPTDTHGLGALIGYINDLVRQRFEDTTDMKPKKDMLGGFIRNGMTRVECEGEAMLAILAGNDTSAATIRATMLQLMLAPHAYAKFKEEVKQAVEQGEVSSPITNDESLKLPYTQAVVWEGLRLGSPTTFGHYKVVPPAGETIHGKFLPGGTRIGHNTIALTRNKQVFGQDADIFRPERFLECGPERKLEMMRALDMVFGGGRWMCSGKNIAIVEFNKVYFELMRAFDFQIVNVLRPCKEIVCIARLHKDMDVKITMADWRSDKEMQV